VSKLNCLVLHPIEHLNLSNYKTKLITALTDLEVISTAINQNNSDCYLSGKNYLNYISFIGCSPYLNFEPRNTITASDLKQTIADLNYIQFNFNTDKFSFNKTDFGVKAICPKCKSKIPEWNNLIINWEKKSTLNVSCSQCTQEISLLDIDWKKTAGFYKSAILFHGIQAELALPVDNFLMLLEKVTNAKWQYFYG